MYSRGHVEYRYKYITFEYTGIATCVSDVQLYRYIIHIYIYISMLNDPHVEFNISMYNIISIYYRYIHMYIFVI